MKLTVYTGEYKAGSSVITDGGFEIAGAGGDDVFSAWNESTPSSPGTDIVRDTVVKRTGAASCKLRNTVAADVSIIQSNTVIAQHVYRLTLWARGSGSHSLRFAVYDATHAEDIVPAARSCGVPLAVWTQFRYQFQAPPGCVLVGLSLYCPYAVGDVWVDDVSMIDLTAIGLSEDGIDWTELTAVLDDGVEWNRGLPGGRVDDLTAGTGVLRFLLDNNGGTYSDPALKGVPVKVVATEDWEDAEMYDGWISANETLTYASAVIFTVAGDQTAKYHKGTKIKLTQTTVKYFYVVSSSYGAPNTTVTVTGGSDYSLANAAITSPYLSYAEIPQGFPEWFSWVPVLTGFSANPTDTHYAFCVKGRTCFITFNQVTDGTSNANDFTFTLPIVAATRTNAQWGQLMVATRDNGALQTTPGRATFGSAATVCALNKDTGTGAWTTSGGKRAHLTLWYEI